MKKYMILKQNYHSSKYIVTSWKFQKQKRGFFTLSIYRYISILKSVFASTQDQFKNIEKLKKIYIYIYVFIHTKGTCKQYV